MKIIMKPTLLVLLCLLMISAQATNLASQNKSRITIASNVRARALPNTSAEEVTKLQIGTIVQELEQSSGKEKIGNNEDYWYKVAMPNGKEGWIFGSFTLPFATNNRAEIYKRIASERLKIKDANFADSADLARFMTIAMTEIGDKNTLVWIELARLLAMKQAGAAIPSDKQDQAPYKAWIKTNEASLVYSEPSGMWLVKSDIFWALQKKYVALPLADEIAWEGAKNYLPGECEGDISCNLIALNRMDGKYVKLYPKGAHIEEALASIIEVLEGIRESLKTAEKPAADERQYAVKDLAELRASITKTVSTKKAKALELLAQFERHYR
jgi:hypothetical protein